MLPCAAGYDRPEISSQSLSPATNTCPKVLDNLDEALQHATESMTITHNSDRVEEPGQLCQVNFQSHDTYGENLRKEILRVEIAEWQTTFGYKASLVQRSIVDHNLEFLETAYTNGHVRIKVNGLMAEGVVRTEPDTLVWSVGRSPISSWCHCCLQIIGSHMRYGEQLRQLSSWCIVKADELLLMNPSMHHLSSW